MIGTRQAATILGVRPGTLSRAMWEGRFTPPAKVPGGAYVWTEADLQQASQAMLGRGLNEDELAKARKEGSHVK